MRAGPGIPLFEAIDYTIQVARTLHRLHKRQVYHRDIKPSNLLVGKDGKILLTDFGLAITEKDQLTEIGAVLGTWTYMSPEQARGESNLVDGRSDIFSLGVTFYHMLTGRLLFQSQNPLSHTFLLLRREVIPPRQIHDAIPQEIERICLKALSKEINQRYTTAADMADDLTRWRAATQASEDSVLPVKRRQFYQHLAVALVAFVLLFAGWHSMASLNTPRLNEKPAGEGAIAHNVNVIVENKDVPKLPPEPDDERPRDGWWALLRTKPQTLMWSPDSEGSTTLTRDQDGTRVFQGVSRRSTWLATTCTHQTHEMQLKAEIEVTDWRNAGGLFWNLHHDPNSELYMCWYASVARHPVNDTEISIHVNRYELRPDSPGRFVPVDVWPAAAMTLPMPDTSIFNFKIHVTEDVLKIELNETVWNVESVTDRPKWLTRRSSQAGLLGNGPLISFRHVEGMNVKRLPEHQ